MEETQIHFIIASIAFIFGIFIGFLIWHRKGENACTLSALQILSVFVFFGYIVIESILGKEPSDLVSTAILTMIGGEVVGKAIADKVVKK